MTTIVYDHESQQIACDSRESTGNGLICSDSIEKFFYVKGDLWFSAGCAADALPFAESAEHNTKAPEHCAATSILVRNGSAHLVCVDENNIYKIQKLTANECIGSGGNFALSALDFGKPAGEAVGYAKTRDMYTGGAIRVYDIRTAKFIE